MTIIENDDDEGVVEVSVRLRIAEYDGDALDAVDRVLDAGVLQDAINDDDDSDVEVLDAAIVFERPATTEAVSSLLSQLNDAVICREAAEVDPDAVARLTRDLVAAVQRETFTKAAQACTLVLTSIADDDAHRAARMQTANQCTDACRALADECV